MTPGSGRPEPIAPPLDRRARAELGLAPGSDPDAVRTAFLRRLADRDFLPDRRERAAFDLLTGRGNTEAQAAWLREDSRAADDRRHAAVEEFAAAFFAIPTAERRGRWQRLVAACADSERLRARLRKLEPGLGIDLARFSDRSPETERLGRLVFTLFVLPSRLEAIRRQELIAELSAAPPQGRGGWQAAALQLWKRHPQIAGLNPVFVSQIAQPPPKPVQSLPRPPLITISGVRKAFASARLAAAEMTMLINAMLQTLSSLLGGRFPPASEASEENRVPSPEEGDQPDDAPPHR